MAIIVDGFCAVFERAILDMALADGAPFALNAIHDEHLACLRFESAAAAESWVARLRQNALDRFGGRVVGRVAVVDPRSGPRGDDGWLQFARHPLGFGYVWPNGLQPGELVGPKSRATTDACDLIELSRENGTIHWLDLTTGRQLVSVESSSPRFPNWYETRCEADLLAPVLEVLGQHGYAVGRSPNTLYVLLARGDVTYHVGFLADAESEIVCSCTFAPNPVPAIRRAAVAEAMARINARLGAGNFELDPESGYMRYRISIFLGGSTLTPRMADHLVHEGVRAWETYAAALARVSRGGIAPASAIRPRVG